MYCILRNLTGSPIEIGDLGITIDTTEDLSIDEDISSSFDLRSYVESGMVVFVLSNGTPLDTPSSITVLNNSIRPTYEKNYTKSEVDTLLSGVRSDTDSKLTALVNSSPEVLNTLSEIATALGNDPNFAATITTALAAKAPLNHLHSQYAIENDVTTALAAKAPLIHTHDSYVDRSELLTALNGKADTSHTHSQYALSSHIHSDYAPIIHNHDVSYYTKAQIDAMAGGFVYGMNHATVVADAITSIISTSYYRKCYLDVSITTYAQYRLGWHFNWNIDNTTSNFKGRIGIEGSAVATFAELVERSLDSAGTFYSTGTDQQHGYSGFQHFYLSPGNYRFYIEYCSETLVTSSMWNARLEFWRTTNA